MPAFTSTIKDNGVCIVTFDLSNEKVNKLTMAVMTELDSLLDDLDERKDIVALVIRSGKEGNFIAGADIAEIRDIGDPAIGERLSRKGQQIMDHIAGLPFPTVAAVNGPCLGGGLELALACTGRVASNDPRTVLGLPEVRLGILPGFGGTQRLPRLVGLTKGLDLILTGRTLPSKKALRIGLVDEVTHREDLLRAAEDLALRYSKNRPHPGVRGRMPLAMRVLESTPLTRSLLLREARKHVLQETRGNYPAPLAALEAVRFGLDRGAAAGYENEARLLGELAVTEVSKNLVSIFYLNEAFKKDGAAAGPLIDRAGVVGAGVMGGGIAQLLAEKGLSVTMKDIAPKAVAAGLREAAAIFRKRVQKGILTPLQARDGMDRISGTTDPAGFGRPAVIIEAVVENLEVKKQVLRDVEAAGREVLFASNTSSLPITELATAAKRPDLVVGMHFFNPVEKMPLVEVVRGKSTSDAATATVASLARRLGKLPVVVHDGPGFLVNRILMPYLNEAALLFEQGASIEAIDDALRDFGMPMGAFILLDEIGIDVAHKVADILHQGLGERAAPARLLQAMHQEGLFGRKAGKGFYRYQGRERLGPDRSLAEKVPGRPKSAPSPAPEEIVERTVLLMIKEATLCLDEGIIDRPDLLDAALVFGIGFPPFRGGLLRYADKLGSRAIVERLEVYAGRFGSRFTPPARLLTQSLAGKGFYS